MKSERRHELKTNSLAHMMETAPAFFTRHGTKLAVGVIFIILAVVVVYRWRDAAAKAQVDSASNLGQTRNVLRDFALRPHTPGDYEGLRESVKPTAEQWARETKDPVVKAGWMLLLADMNRMIADASKAPAEARTSSLNEADRLYNAIISDFSTLHREVANARLGLATIEEDRAYDDVQAALTAHLPVPASPHWDAARKQYEAVQGDSNLSQALRDLAKGRIATLDKAKTPVQILPPLPPATGPSTNMHPATSPAAAPATRATSTSGPAARGAGPSPAPAAPPVAVH